MAVSGIYGYHATKTGPKCSLVWMASCFVIPPSVQCRNIGTWDDISDELHRLQYGDSESDDVMPRMLTHADLHSESKNNVNEIYRLSPEPYRNDTDGNSDQEKDRSFEHEDPINDYLAEYAQIISSKEEEEENYTEEYIRPSETSGQTHNEKRKKFARRKSCSDVSKKAGLSFGLSVPKDQTADDFHVHTSQSSATKSTKPEKFDLKNITAMARRMSIPILDKSEDVDHGTKVYGEKLIKKSKTTKQFREAFSEETDDYIPHRAPKTLSKSLTTTEIENACDELKNEKPGSMKNIVAELKLRGQNFNESHRSNENHNDQDINSYQKMSKSLTMSEIEKASDDYKIESPAQFRSVMKELQQRTEEVAEDGYHHDESFGSTGNSLDQSFTGSHTSDSSHTNSLRRNRSDDSRRMDKNNYMANKSSDPVRGYSNSLQSNRAYNTCSTEMRNNRTNRHSDSLRESHFSKTLPANFEGNISGASTPRNYHYEHNPKINSTKQKSEEPASDLMKKLNNLTAQTRMATRPSLGNIEGYDPSSSTMMRSQSVMNVSSPLSPRYDRNPLSSSLSSSASSSSDIPAISYHSVVDPCHRCWKTVYSLDKIGPIRKVLYHKQCFRCVTCNTMLSLNTYKHNVNDKSDVQIYCKKHVPTLESPHIDLGAKNLNVMMHHPKLDSVNTNIRGTLEDKRKSRNLHPLSIGRAVSTPRLDLICGPNDNFESYGDSSIDKNGNVSLRELKMDDAPRSVWSRSSFSAAKLDLTVPASGRTGSSLYRTVDTWNYL